MPNRLSISSRLGFFTLKKHLNLSRHQFTRPDIPARLIVLFSVSFFAFTQITGCVNFAVRAGVKPDVAALEKSLTQGTSTEQDVIKALGVPTGKGREMLPFMDAPRVTWTYYYEEGDVQDDRRLFLFVFLANSRFDGYMWFSSLPEFKPALGK